MKMLSSNLLAALYQAIRESEGANMEGSIYIEGLKEVAEAIVRGERIEIIRGET